MSGEDLLKIARAICRQITVLLGNDGDEFLPTNTPELGATRGKELWRRTKLMLLREMTKVTPADQVDMYTLVSQVARKVKAFKAGACGELSMFAYNIARVIPGTHAQIIEVQAADGSTDTHAFVLMGVDETFAAETKLSDIAANHPTAVIIDYWASQNTYTTAKGAFKISEFAEQAEDALTSYDLDKVRSWTV